VYLEKPVAVDVALSAGVSSRSTSKISNAKKAVIPGSTSATSTGRQCERAFAEIGYAGSVIAELEPGDEAYLRDVSRRIDRLLLDSA